MLRSFLALIFTLILFVPGGARAQGDITLSAVEVNLWPEYDRPEVLVMYDLTLPPQVTLPVDLTIRIPASAGQPHAVAARQPDGALINLTHNVRVAGDWLEISLTATTPDAHLEYYDPGLAKDGVARHFEYQWPGDYAVNSMRVLVQQPIGATNMVISPSLGQGSPAQGGLVYYSSDVGSLAAGESFTITFDYNKNSDALSSSSLTVQPSGPIDEATAGRTTTMQDMLPWVLGGLGLLLIVGGGVWYWQSGRQKTTPAQRHSRRRAAAKREATPATPQQEGHIYCHECGKRAAPGDRFCRTCGAQLRSG